MYSVYVILSDFPVWYGLYYESHYRPHAFYTSFISVNHIRLHATCSCYLVLMVTGVVMRGEMREWWMVIVVLLLLNVWPGTILLVPRSALMGCLGLLWVYSEMSVYCCLRPVVMKTNSQGWVFCVLITRHFMLHFDLIRIKWLFFSFFFSFFFSGALKQMGWRETWANTHVFSRGLRCVFVCILERLH